MTEHPRHPLTDLASTDHDCAPRTADRASFVRSWISRRQKAATAGLVAGGAMLLPVLAQAQDGGGTELGSLDSVRSYTLLEDGSVRLTLENGRTVMVAAQDVTIGASGEILVAQAVVEALAEFAALAGGVGAGAGLAAAAGLGLAAAAGGGGGGGSSSAGIGGPAAPEPAISLELPAALADGRLNAAEVAEGFAVSGTVSHFTGATGVLVHLNGEAIDAPISIAANGSWGFGINPGGLSDLPDGTHTVLFDVVDKDGKVLGSREISFTLDTTPPVISIDPPDEVPQAALGAPLRLSGTTDAEAGQQVTVTLNGKSYTGTVADGSWSVEVPAADLAALPAGAAQEIRAGVADQAGNSAPPATGALSIQPPPPLISIDGPVFGDNMINAAEKDAGGQISGTTTAEDGQTVTLSFGGSTFTTEAAAGRWQIGLTPEQLEGIADGSLTLTASVSNAAGIAAEPASLSVTLDTVAPTLSLTPISGDGLLSAFEKLADLVIAGNSDAGEGREVEVTLNGARYTGAVGADGRWAVEVPKAALAGVEDGDVLTITARVSDPAGNSRSAEAVLTADFADTSVSIDEIGVASGKGGNGAVDVAALAAGEFTLSGTAPELPAGARLLVTVNGTEHTAAVTGGIWTLDLPPLTLAPGAELEVAARILVGDALVSQAAGSAVGHAFSGLRTAIHDSDDETHTFAVEVVDRSAHPGGVVNSVQLSVKVEGADLVAGTGAFSGGLLGQVNRTDLAGGELRGAAISADGVPFTQFENDPLFSFSTSRPDGAISIHIGNSPVNQAVNAETGFGGSLFLFGSDGDDILVAGDVDTTIRGQRGNDTINLSDGRGAHSIIFDADPARNGTDTVEGFTLGDGFLADTIRIAGLGSRAVGLRGRDGAIVTEEGAELEAGVGFVIFDGAVETLDAAAIETLVGGFGGLAEGDVFFLTAGVETGDAGLLARIDVGAEGATAHILAQFSGIAGGDAVTAHNILGFNFG